MSAKEKLIETVGAHPRVLTFGIGLVIVAVVAVGLNSTDLSFRSYSFR